MDVAVHAHHQTHVITVDGQLAFYGPLLGSFFAGLDVEGVAEIIAGNTLIFLRVGNLILDDGIVALVLLAPLRLETVVLSVLVVLILDGGLDFGRSIVHAHNDEG